jgi:hypothetical protein
VMDCCWTALRELIQWSLSFLSFDIFILNLLKLDMN